jgi:hypothetical protein
VVGCLGEGTIPFGPVGGRGGGVRIVVVEDATTQEGRDLLDEALGEELELSE